MQTKPLYKELATRLSEYLERTYAESNELKNQIDQLDAQRSKLISRLNENLKDEKRLTAALNLFKNDSAENNQPEQTQTDQPQNESNTPNSQHMLDLAKILEALKASQNKPKTPESKGHYIDPTRLIFWM